MKARYRKGGKWVKEGTEGATFWGVQDGRKMRQVDLETLEATAFRKGGNSKPTLRYREGGKFIGKEIAQFLETTQEFQEVQAKKVEAANNELSEQNEIGEGTAFYSIASDFKESFVDDFGFKSLTINQLDEDGNIVKTKTTKSLATALFELNQKGYEGAKFATEANQSGDPTPPEVFSIPIYMSEDERGVYSINFSY